MPTRRRFLSMLAATPVIAALETSARAEGTRILMVGSSMMGSGFGLYLGQDLAREYGCIIDRRGRPSTGLARPDFHDWFAEAEDARAEFSPDMVVVMFGGNDCQGLYMGRNANPKWIRWGEPEWVPEYRRRVNRFCDLIAPAPAVQLVWLGMCQVESAQLLERVAMLNDIYETETALRSNARFVRTWDAMTLDGEYSSHLDVNGQRTRIRTPDGVHVTVTGAHMFADYVRPYLAPLV